MSKERDAGQGSFQSKWSIARQGGILAWLRGICRVASLFANHPARMLMTVEHDADMKYILDL